MYLARFVAHLGCFFLLLLHTGLRATCKPLRKIYLALFVAHLGYNDKALRNSTWLFFGTPGLHAKHKKKHMALFCKSGLRATRKPLRKMYLALFLHTWATITKHSGKSTWPSFVCIMALSSLLYLYIGIQNGGGAPRVFEFLFQAVNILAGFGCSIWPPTYQPPKSSLLVGLEVGMFRGTFSKEPGFKSPRHPNPPEGQIGFPGLFGDQGGLSHLPSTRTRASNPIQTANL